MWAPSSPVSPGGAPVPLLSPELHPEPAAGVMTGLSFLQHGPLRRPWWRSVLGDGKEQETTHSGFLPVRVRTRSRHCPQRDHIQLTEGDTAGAALSNTLQWGAG